LCDGEYTRMLDEVHRKNGNLIRETSAFKKAVETLESEYRSEAKKPLGHEVLMSPVSGGRRADSPIASRMLNFLASPVRPLQV
jgi:hypothetical protein